MIQLEENGGQRITDGMIVGFSNENNHYEDGIGESCFYERARLGRDGWPQPSELLTCGALGLSRPHNFIDSRALNRLCAAPLKIGISVAPRGAASPSRW